MYRIKNDQRSVRSSEMLYDGLAKLMRQMPFDAIKVKDLVEAAQVGRTTFYRHFDGIDDVLRMRCDQVFSGLIEHLVRHAATQAAESRAVLLKPLLRYFYLHSEILELLMLAKRQDMIYSSFRRALEPFKLRVAARLDLDEEYASYRQTIQIAVATSILLHWIETGKRQAPDELADRIGAMNENRLTLEQFLEIAVPEPFVT
jgi:AcrR family transcriptional regulator